MKIKKIAAAVLGPTAVAGTVLLGWTTVHASAGHTASQPVSHVARPVTHAQTSQRQLRSVRHARHRAQHPASPAKRPIPPPPSPTPPSPTSPPPTPSAPSTPAAAASPASLTSGRSSFERCVAWRESGDNPTASSAGMFGILPSTWASLGYAGTAGQAPVALQKAAFDRLYAQLGTQPWAAYDGC